MSAMQKKKMITVYEFFVANYFSAIQSVVTDAQLQLPVLNLSFCNIKPWPNGRASSRKWTQIELAQRLALGGQTARKFLPKYTQVVKKRHFKADYPLFYWLIIG